MSDILVASGSNRQSFLKIVRLIGSCVLNELLAQQLWMEKIQWAETFIDPFDTQPTQAHTRAIDVHTIEYESSGGTRLRFNRKGEYQLFVPWTRIIGDGIYRGRFYNSLRKEGLLDKTDSFYQTLVWEAYLEKADGDYREHYWDASVWKHHFKGAIFTVYAGNFNAPHGGAVYLRFPLPGRRSFQSQLSAYFAEGKCGILAGTFSNGKAIFIGSSCDGLQFLDEVKNGKIKTPPQVSAQDMNVFRSWAQYDEWIKFMTANMPKNFN